MSSTTKILLFIPIVLLVAILSVLYGTGFIRFPWNNTLSVRCDDGLSSANVEIKTGFNSINRRSDQELFETKHTTIYNNGNKTKLRTEYGENDFLIIYGGQYFFSFRQFIETDFIHDEPSGGSYSFHFFKKAEQLFVGVKITGDQPMKFEHQLIPIIFASQYLCNAPIDTTKTVYNMVELNK